MHYCKERQQQRCEMHMRNVRNTIDRKKPDQKVGRKAKPKTINDVMHVDSLNAI